MFRPTLILCILLISSLAPLADAASRRASDQTAPNQVYFSFGGMLGVDRNFPMMQQGPVDTNAYSGGLGVEIGLMSELRFLRDWGVELDVIYLQRNWTITNPTSFAFNENINQSMVQFPLLLRYHLPQSIDVLKYFALGAGPYFGAFVGTVNTTITGNVAPGAGTSNINTDATYSQYNWSMTEWGIVGSINFAYPVAPNWALLADVRMGFDLTDMDNSAGSTRKFDDFQALIGAKVSFY